MPILQKCIKETFGTNKFCKSSLETTQKKERKIALNQDFCSWTNLWPTKQAKSYQPDRNGEFLPYSVWNLVPESKKKKLGLHTFNFRITSTNNVWVSPLASQHHVLFIQLRSKKNESLVASHSVLLLWNYLWVDTLIFLFILWVNYFSSKGWRKE